MKRGEYWLETVEWRVKKAILFNAVGESSIHPSEISSQETTLIVGESISKLHLD